MLDDQEAEFEKKIADLKDEMKAMVAKHIAAMNQQKIDIYERILFKQGA